MTDDQAIPPKAMFDVLNKINEGVEAINRRVDDLHDKFNVVVIWIHDHPHSATRKGGT